MRIFSLLFLAFASAVSLRAGEWRVGSVTSDFSANKSVEHRHVVMMGDAGAEATLELAVFSTKAATFRIYDQATATHADLEEVMTREHCVAGVNGGYFDPNFAPVGLLIAEGKVLSPLRKAKLLSGVAEVVSGRVQLLRLAEYSPRKTPSSAVQCGPFLVDRSRAVPGLNGTRSARRTFMMTAGDRAAIGYCSGATLAELADMLAAAGLLGDGKIERAMNLDGGSSSAFWFDGGTRPTSIGEQKSVRNFVGVVAK